MALIGCTIVTETNSKTSENVWFIIVVKKMIICDKKIVCIKFILRVV